MKRFLLMIILASLVVSCGGEKKSDKVDKKLLFGELKGRTYTNEFFNFKITVGKGWEINPTGFRSRLSADLFDVKFPDKDPRDTEPLASIHIESEKVNPFTKPSLKKQLEDMIEGMQFLYDPDELTVGPFEKATLGGNEFMTVHMTVEDDSGKYFVDEYVLHHEGYYLSITASYDEDQPAELVKKVLSEMTPAK